MSAEEGELAVRQFDEANIDAIWVEGDGDVSVGDAASYITRQTLYVDGGLTTQLTPPGIYIKEPVHRTVGYLVGSRCTTKQVIFDIFRFEYVEQFSGFIHWLFWHI